MSNSSASRLKKIQILLEAQREEYLKRAQAIRNDVGRGVSPDSSERVVEMGNAMVLEELEREASEELKKIQLALDRISAGRYGKCLICDDEIELERLSAYPLAVHCLSCAEDEERVKLRR